MNIKISFFLLSLIFVSSCFWGNTQRDDFAWWPWQDFDAKDQATISDTDVSSQNGDATMQEKMTQRENELIDENLQILEEMFVDIFDEQ